MKKILVLSREPYLDKIPNLMSLLKYMSAKGEDITIFSAVEDAYLTPSFVGHDNIVLQRVFPKKYKYSMPRTLSIFVKAITHIICNGFKGIRYTCIIGADYYANAIALLLSRLTGALYVNHCLEYPSLKSYSKESYTYKDVIYNNFILKKSDYIITHDKVHVKVISESIDIEKDKFLELPNSSLGDIRDKKTDVIREKFEINNEKKIVLHSGGLGEWFNSAEIARDAMTWGENIILVFHTNHNARTSEYFKKMNGENYKEKVLFSTSPVTSEKLDDFVSGADIGLAWYNYGILGYRCENMGLAAGKIGNYLKCGLPVITNNFHSLSSYIEGYDCGVCVDAITEITEAINIINANLSKYRKNALKCYQELWKPDRYLKDIYEIIKYNK